MDSSIGLRHQQSIFDNEMH